MLASVKTSLLLILPVRTYIVSKHLLRRYCWRCNKEFKIVSDSVEYEIHIVEMTNRTRKL